MVKKSNSVIILAGGDSKRFGLPKPFLLFSPRLSFLERLTRVYYRFGCTKIVVVLNERFHDSKLIAKLQTKYNAKFVINHHPAKGRLHSLKLGLASIKGEDFCFIQNVDNPFTNLSFLNTLNRLKTPDGYTLPVFRGKGGHPIIIGKAIIKGIKKAKFPGFNLRIFLKKYQRIEAPVSNEKITANINTLNDYRKYFYYDAKSAERNHEKHIR